MPPEFTSDWVTTKTPDWRAWLGHLVDRPVTMLEIGCWEGRSALWLLDHVLTHPAARLICVDPYGYDNGREQIGPQTLAAARRRFVANTKQARDAGRIEWLDERSETALRRFGRHILDAAYIDGDHTAPAVLTDSVLVWPALRPGGVVIWDDVHGWNEHRPDHQRPRLAVDSFLACHTGEFELLGRTRQVAVRKL